MATIKYRADSSSPWQKLWVRLTNIFDFEATIAASDWYGTEAPYVNVIDVDGLLATDRPTVDLIASDDYATAEAQIEAYGAVYRMETHDGSMTVYATEAPTVDIPIQIRAVRN